MKVNTDGVLLGAAMTILPQDRCLLDIGTGTGTIAIMAAQRICSADRYIADAPCNDMTETDLAYGCVMGISDIRIDAIDIDEPSATEASMNFANSPWSECLHAQNLSLGTFAAMDVGAGSSDSPVRKYDLIFSNPPYFEDSLTAPDERKSAARHTSDGLSYRDIFEFAKERLTDDGRVSLVLPAEQEAALCRYARMCGLHLFRILRIRTVPRKAPSRMIAEFSRRRCDRVKEDLLTIQNEGQYTQEYLSLTHDFYLFA